MFRQRYESLVVTLALIAAATARFSPDLLQADAQRAPNRIDAGSEAVLRRARDWAGGMAVDSIRSVAVDTQQSGRSYSYRLMLPDKFQRRTGAVVSTLAGGTFWQEYLDGAATADARLARRNLEGSFVLRAITFLLTVPEARSLVVAEVGMASELGLTGHAIRVSGPDDFDATFFFSTEDGRLVGYASAGLAGSVASHLVPVRIVTKILDYRKTASVQFPRRLETRTPVPGRSPITVIVEVDRVELDTLADKDFSRGGGPPVHSRPRDFMVGRDR